MDKVARLGRCPHMLTAAGCPGVGTAESGLCCVCRGCVQYVLLDAGDVWTMCWSNLLARRLSLWCRASFARDRAGAWHAAVGVMPLRAYCADVLLLAV